VERPRSHAGRGRRAEGLANAAGAVMGKHRWKGDLARPIRPRVIRPRGLRVTKETAQPANEEMEALYRRAIEREYLVKLELLMDHYGITDKTDFPSLALALAIELRIPGFKVDPTPLTAEQIDDEGMRLIVQEHWKGPRPKWPLKRHKLLSAVTATKQRHGISKDNEALSILANHPEWAPPYNHRGDRDRWLKTLKNQLAEARRFSK
jgi:hypothetical protein